MNSIDFFSSRLPTDPAIYAYALVRVAKHKGFSKLAIPTVMLKHESKNGNVSKSVSVK
jgi:hypothetical protein